MSVDLEAARRDLFAFAEMLGEPLAPWQAAALQLERTISCVVAPRGAGKSRGLALLALHHAFTRSDAMVLLVSASEDSSRRLLAEVRRFATGSRLLAGSVVDEQAGLLRLSSGAVIRSVAASEKAVRGWRATLLLLDEAALIPDAVAVGAALPTVSSTEGGRIVLASSATAAAGFFYDTFVRGARGDEHVAAHRWRLDDCWWISPSVVAAMRSSMTPSRFAAEMEGSFDAGGDLLFPRRLLDAVTADFPPTALARLTGPATVFAGQDWGAHRDRSAFVGISRFAGERMFGVRCVERWPAGAELARVVEDVASSPAAIDWLTMERNGLGEMACQALLRRLRERPAEMGGGRRGGLALVDAEKLDEFVARASARRAAAPVVTRAAALFTSAQSKAASYGAARWMMEEGALVLPAGATELRRELELTRVEPLPSGGERIGASTGFDDLADALSFALGPYRTPDGRWRCALADLADPSAPLPAPALPADFELRRLERVRTAGGLEVPVSPVWQSPRGERVTLPGLPRFAPAPLDPRLADVRAAVASALSGPTERTA